MTRNSIDSRKSSVIGIKRFGDISPIISQETTLDSPHKVSSKSSHNGRKSLTASLKLTQLRQRQSERHSFEGSYKPEELDFRNTYQSNSFIESLTALRRQSCAEYRSMLVKTSKRLSQDNTILEDQIPAEDRARSSNYRASIITKGKSVVRRSTLIPRSQTYDKILGGEYQVMQQNIEVAKQKTIIIHPYSSVKGLWDSMTLIVMLVNLFFFPIDECFYQREKEFYTLRVIISIFFDVWLYLDILMTFRTGFVKSGIDGEIVFHPVAIRKEYMAFWFWVDLVSTVPLDVIISCLVILIRTLACNVFNTPLGSVQLFGLDSLEFELSTALALNSNEDVLTEGRKLIERERRRRIEDRGLLEMPEGQTSERGTIPLRVQIARLIEDGTLPRDWNAHSQ